MRTPDTAAVDNRPRCGQMQAADRAELNTAACCYTRHTEHGDATHGTAGRDTRGVRLGRLERCAP
jgi:hypothetical protein